nr:unnamed protein product [Spirometra erinaceieuropaei]
MAKQQPTPSTPPTPTPSLNEPPPPPPPEASDNERLNQPRQMPLNLPDAETVPGAEGKAVLTVADTETRESNDADTDRQQPKEQEPAEAATDPSQFIYEDIMNDFDAEEEKEGGGEAVGGGIKTISGIGDAEDGDGMHQLDADFDICLTGPGPRPPGRPRTPDEPGGDEEAHYEQLGRGGDDEEELASSDDEVSGALNSPADVVVVGEVAEEDSGATGATDERGPTKRLGKSEPAKDRSYSPGLDRVESPPIDVEEVTPHDGDEKLVEELEDGEELTDGEADLEDEEEEEASTTVFAAYEDIQEGQLVVLFLLHRKLDVREDRIQMFPECQQLTPVDNDEGIIHLPGPELWSMVLEDQRLLPLQDRLGDESRNRRTNWCALHVLVDCPVEPEVRPETELQELKDVGMSMMILRSIVFALLC